LFSLGIVCFETLTGRLPYRHGTVEQVFQRHCEEQPDDIRRHVPRLPPALANLTDRLMAREPRERPRILAVVQQLAALEMTVRWRAA
jgi:serine/threonine-protein kinase